jgi:hypothetical protein
MWQKKNGNAGDRNKLQTSSRMWQKKNVQCAKKTFRSSDASDTQVVNGHPWGYADCRKQKQIFEIRSIQWISRYLPLS